MWLVVQAGSTCTVATVFGDALIVANIGDSDAILCRKGVPYMLSYQHKASDEAEKQRIIASGGSVFFNVGSWRVAGMLEVRCRTAHRCSNRLGVFC